ncbi:MAG: T9SS type A sorting domain-containing protein [bacterium]|nr:T9SS type A sorting domain-containing protein [bacterium]
MHPVKTAERILAASLLLSLWTASGAADRGPGFPAQVQVDDQRINDDTGAADQSRPAIDMHRGGLAVVAWPDGRNGDLDIYFQLYNRRGSAFGTLGNVRVNDDLHGNVMQKCDVAMDGYGHFLVAWDAGYGSESHAIGQWYYANGKPMGGNFRIDEGAGAVRNGGVALAGVDSGGAVAVWSDRRNNANGEIMLQIFDRYGNMSAAGTRVHPESDSGMVYAAVDVSPAGKGWVVWQEGTGTAGNRIMARRFGIESGLRGNAFQVAPQNDPGAVNCMGPVVGVGPDGAATVFWMTDYGDGVIRRRACLYDSGGTPVVGPFFVDEDDKFGFQGELSVCRFDDGHSFFLWSGNVAGDWNIYIRSCDAAGVFNTASVPVNDTPGLQFGADIVTDGGGIVQMVWYDRRNGVDFDVYGTRLTNKAPMALTAGSGFDGRVPLSWEPPYGDSSPTRYLIYRSESPVEVPLLISTVDLTTRPFPDRMRDFIDFTAENGKSYYYSVRPDAAGSLSSIVGNVTPAAGGHVIRSAWCDAPPTVDGSLALGEWMTATDVDISEPSGLGDVHLFLMNDQTNLYLAVNDTRDTQAEPASTLGLLIDPNNDGAWPAAGPSEEGLLGFTPAGGGFLGYWGAYPEGLGGNAAVSPVLAPAAVSAGSGHVVYECALPLTDPPHAFAPGGTFGFAVAVSDPGNFYSYHYGYAGEWPPGALWEAAETLGHLTLASGPDAVDAESDFAADFSLGRNYPNPFNPVTTVPFRIDRAGRVTLKIYDALGSMVSVMADERYEAGSHAVLFDASGLASGVYIVRMEAEGFTASRKIAVVK